MPPQTSDDQLGQAILQSIRDGSYPENEETISAELPSSALTALSGFLEEAKVSSKASIRELSKEIAPDIDGWIAQAQQLQNDIDNSHKVSQDIVIRAKEGDSYNAKLQDTNAKLDLLNGELAFNEHLARTLQQLHGIRHILDLGQEAVLAGRLPQVIDLIDQAKQELSFLKLAHNTQVNGLIRARIDDLRNMVAETATDCWNALLHVDTIESAVTIKHETPRSSMIDIHTVVLSLDKLGLLKSRIFSFRKDFDTLILTPRLKLQDDGTVGSIVINGDSIQLSGRTANMAIQSLFSDLNAIIDYLDAHLPSAVVAILSEALMPDLISRIVSEWLSPSIPIDLEGISQFQALADLTLEFSNSLHSHEWYGERDLLEWIDQAPKLWFTQKCEASLNRVRQVLANGLGDLKMVERIETQLIARGEVMFAGNGAEGDWNAEWSDHENGDTSDIRSQHSGVLRTNEEEEDVSAWGLDETVNESSGQPVNTQDDADAWGWGDEKDDGNGEATESLESPTSGNVPSRSNGRPAKSPLPEREVSLREIYTITSLPEQIIEMILQIVSDGTTLTQQNYASSPIAPAATGLFALPSLLLSMYRATAPSHYSNDANGNMFLYNDSLWMSERLRVLSDDQSLRSASINPRSAGKLNLGSDISALEVFGKRAYGKEMESQRTILGDLLDGAQGFSNCTEHPFAQECDLAISSTVDRLRDVYKHWKAVLSHSALLQSTGSLLSTVINKIIVDVEDMSDISEPESQRLASFCNRIASLEDLFALEKSPEDVLNDQQPISLTAVYAPNWLKFQYLSNILESSLVDIKYLWTEGELGLEFSAEELIDLIEALFADSEHRRRAIGDIRRGAVRI